MKKLNIYTYTVLFMLLITVGILVEGAQHQQVLRQRAQTPPAGGNQLFVSPNGSGTACTQAAPCSLKDADAKATPGTTILAASGNYPGNFATTKGGSAGNFITYKSQEKYGATIVGTGENSAVDIKNPFVRFEGFTVTGEKTRNGFIINADNVEVIGNHIHHITQWKTGGTGWQGGAGVDIGKSPLSNILIDSNYIHHVGAPGSTEQLVHGMYLAGHVTNGRVTNNVIHNVEDFGLHPYDETEASGWHFINNTIANTGRGILQAPNGVTRNNVVFNTKGAAYEIRGSGNVIQNNIHGGTGSAGAGNGTGVTKADPMLVNPAENGGDFRLKPGSPAIDKGSADGAPKNDFDGKTRPQGAGIDMGAFENGGAAPSGAAVPSGTANPTFGVIAPCPSCASPTNPLSNGQGQIPNTGTTISQAPVTDPCPGSYAAPERGKKKSGKHNKHEGAVSEGIGELLKAILEFFIKLLELLFGGNFSIPNNNGNPVEDPSDDPIDNPVDVPTGSITQPCPSPDSQPSEMPMVPSGGPSNTVPSPGTTSKVPVGTKELFVADYEPGNFSQWEICHNHLVHGSCSGYPTTDYAVKIVKAPEARQGQYAAQFTLRNGDEAVDGGERTEFSTHAAGALTHEGDERWYEWSMKVPANFVNPTANYFLTMQWHHLGDDSPPMAVAISKDGKVYLDPGDESMGTILGTVKKGEWVDYVLHAKFSKTSGWVEGWENGVQTLQRKPFQTMKDNENYLKTGIYRSSGTKEEAIVFLDGLRITAP